MTKSPLANYVRIPSALLLIALEFTSLVRFLAEGGTHSSLAPFSIHAIHWFAAYGIWARNNGARFKSAKRFLDKPIVLWAFASLMLFTWGMLVRVFNARPESRTTISSICSACGLTKSGFCFAAQ